MSTSFKDEAGITRLRGTLDPAPGGAQTLAEVLATGADANGIAITNLSDPNDAQDADTQAARDFAIAQAIAAIPPPSTPNLNAVLDAGGDADSGTISNLAHLGVETITGTGDTWNTGGGSLVMGNGDISGCRNLEVDATLNHDGTQIGLYGATPTARSAAIPDVVGGVVIDAQARSALNDLLAYLRLRGDITP